MSGVAALTATALVVTPIQALPRDVTVAADPAPEQPAVSQQFVDLLAAVQRLASTPGSAQLAADAPAPAAALVAFPGLGNAIINTYNAIEPWVQYGVDVAAYALGWIPFGWIAGDQIQIFYTSLIEPIAKTITYNIAYWIGGSEGFLQGLNNVILDSANAGIGFLNAEINWGWGLLPPLPFPPPQIPNLPWFGLLQTQTGLAADAITAPDVAVQNAASNLVDAIYIPVRNGIDYGVDLLQYALAPIPLAHIAGDQVSIVWNSLVEPISNSVVFDLVDPVLNQPLNINSYINGAYDVGATTVNSLIDTGINEINYVLGFPLIPTAAAQTSQVERTAEVSTVPSAIKNSLAPERGNVHPLREVKTAIDNVRNDVRTGLTDRRADDTSSVSEAADAVGNGVVRAQGEVRGAVTKTVSDLTGAVRGKPKQAAEDADTPSTNVVKSLGDTARNAVKQVRDAAKNARGASTKEKASDADE
ncbi:hypothetical protein DVS77_13380 [Mycolicibacterium moriokaense]|nr:hypothetical protein DVS77_13380 [Mycolicibacterium moriokaense]